MSQKHHCRNCHYFSPSDLILCAVHPGGPGSQQCPDWRERAVVIDNLTGQEFVNCLGERWRVIRLVSLDKDGDHQWLCQSGTEIAPEYMSEIKRMQKVFGR